MPEIPLQQQKHLQQKQRHHHHHHQQHLSSKLPSLLAPNVLVAGPWARREEGSLTLVTWTQGATANWLVLLYLYTILGGGGGRRRKDDDGGGDDGDGDGEKVVLVSFLRDERFWSEGCARLGLDLDRLRKSGRFSFVDGLAMPLFERPGNDISNMLDVIKVQVDARLLPMTRAPGARIVLVVDGLDAFAAMMPTGSAPAAVDALLMRLRENVSSTLVILAADEPLMQAAQRRHPRQLHQHQQTGNAAKPTTALEKNHAALVLGQAHAADQIISLRRLDTGAAADVSGVVRITTRGGRDDDDDNDEDESEELLYHVSGDGSVRVFERGA